ncbi:hypothetical protein C8Q78DRAFT_1146839 [Trametes maxima]|nr:hypothetical protein C8Q78DRAFT_1146839 [Trametes maxima]
MPRTPAHTISTTTSCSSNRRITRRMARGELLTNIANTAGDARDESPAPAMQTTAGLKARYATEERPKANITDTCKGVSRHDQQFHTGAKVRVYMKSGDSWRWRTGKIANLRIFRPRETGDGHCAYPVLLSQRYPRIIQWFNEDQKYTVKWGFAACGGYFIRIRP